MKKYRVMPKTSQLPNALYTAEQVRELDKAVTESFGIASEELMERAGAAAFSLLHEHWPDAKSIIVLAGVGNNAGDGFVLARLARQAGLQVQVLQLGDRDSLKGDARLNADRYAESGGDWEDFSTLPANIDVIVDGLLGTGLQSDVKGQWAAAVQAANAHKAAVLSLDIPSGLHADTGAVLGVAVRADLTISFIGLKRGMFTAAAPDYCGEIVFDALEVPAKVYASQILAARRLDWRKQSILLEPRPRTAHKGYFGHVLVIGGNLGFGGAARLAAESALRAGAGLVTLATRPEHVSAALSARPEIMVHGVVSEADIEPLIQRASVIAIGPGLGQDNWGRALWDQVRQVHRPLVVDADALSLLAQSAIRRDDWILTPHPGEAASLLGQCVASIQENRFDTVEQLIKRYGGVAVLKGAGTLIDSTGNRPVAVCDAGNPGMASGGMGDVLTGIIAGFLAQGFDLEEAASMGVCLHAAAADKAAAEAGERGLLASDLIAYIQGLVNTR